MTAQEALVMVDQVCSQVALKRDVNNQVIIAINTLQEAITPDKEMEEAPQE